MKLLVAVGLLALLLPACSKKKKSDHEGKHPEIVVSEDTIAEISENPPLGDGKSSADASQDEQAQVVNPAPRYKQVLSESVKCDGDTRLPSFSEVKSLVDTGKVITTDFSIVASIDNRAYAKFDNSALIWYQAMDSRTSMVRRSIAALSNKSGKAEIVATFLYNSETDSYIDLAEASLGEQEAHLICIAK